VEFLTQNQYCASLAASSCRIVSYAFAAPVERTNQHKVEHVMQRGTIKWFDSEKGFGFIEPQEGGEDVFLHVSNITGSTGGDDLRDGQTVAFETERTEKGLSALNASPVG
jgi:CspA family cold shock protein